MSENTKQEQGRDTTAESVYENFQDPTACRELRRMLLNSGLLAEILGECAEYIQEDEQKKNRP